MTLKRMVVILLGFFATGIQAENNPYFDLGKKMPLDAKTLQEARKQVDDFRELKLRDEPGIASFHKRISRPETDRQPLCQTCHPALPHRRSVHKRSFLNMHTRYVTCETCHFQPKGIEFEYRWLVFGEAAVGNVREIDRQQGDEKSNTKIPSLIPDGVSRIAPFLNDQPALLFKDDPSASEIVRAWDEGSDEEKTRLKARLHVSLEKDGRRCADCHHRKQALLDWRILNASDRQIRAIEENAIAQFFSRYKKKDQRLRMTELLR